MIISIFFQHGLLTPDFHRKSSTNTSIIDGNREKVEADRLIIPRETHYLRGISVGPPCVLRHRDKITLPLILEMESGNNPVTVESHSFGPRDSRCPFPPARSAQNKTKRAD